MGLSTHARLREKGHPAAMRALRAFLFLAFAAFPARSDDVRNASMKRAFDKLGEEFGMPLWARPAAAAPLSAAAAVDHSAKPDEESLRKSVDELVGKSEHPFSG